MNRNSHRKSNTRKLARKISLGRNGTTLVEMAVTMSLAFFFFFAALEFCRVSSMRHAVELALYEGARQGIVPGATSTEVETQARHVLATLGISTATIDVTPQTLTDSDSQVQIRIQLPLDRGLFAPALFFVGKSLDRSLTMHREGNR